MPSLPQPARSAFSSSEELADLFALSTDGCSDAETQRAEWVRTLSDVTAGYMNAGESAPRYVLLALHNAWEGRRLRPQFEAMQARARRAAQRFAADSPDEVLREVRSRADADLRERCRLTPALYLQRQATQGRVRRRIRQHLYAPIEGVSEASRLEWVRSRDAELQGLLEARLADPTGARIASAASPAQDEPHRDYAAEFDAAHAEWLDSEIEAWRAENRRQEQEIEAAQTLPAPTSTPSEISTPSRDGKLTRRRSLRLLSVPDLKNLPDPAWLVKSLVQKRTLIELFGAEGSSKTFLALDLALCIATGTPFQSHEVAQGRVVYVYAEGAPGIKARIVAWEMEHGFQPLTTPGAWFLPYQINLMDRDNVNALADEIERVVGPECDLIVIDTLAKAFGGGDEDKTAEMNRFVLHMDDLRIRFGASVLILHHTGWDESREKSNRALRANADTVMSAEKKGANGEHVTLSCVKPRDVPPFDPIKLDRVELSLPESLGLPPDLATSCVLRLAGSGRPPLTNDERTMLEALAEHGRSYGDWLEAASLSESTFKRTRAELTTRGYVTKPPEGDSKGFEYELTAQGRAVLAR